jgi:hypothetical protein
MCNPNYAGGIGERIMVQGQPQAKSKRPYLKNKSKEGWGLAQGAFLVSWRP